MQNMLKKIHREGFTWRDSLFIHGVIVLAIFLISEIPQSFLMILIPVWLSGMDGDFTQTLAFYGSFIVVWVILILFCIIVKSNRPILGSLWRGLKGNTVPKYLIGLLFGFGLNVLSIGAAVLHGDIRITWPGVAASAIGPLLIVSEMAESLGIPKRTIEREMKRAIIIGSPGAGKSTFARQVRDITGLPLYYLDMIWHLPDRTTITKDEFDQKLMEVCLAGAKARVGKKREEIPWVEEEFDEEFRQWIIDFPETKLPQIYGLLEQYGAGKEIHIFRSREDANKYLESING